MTDIQRYLWPPLCLTIYDDWSGKLFWMVKSLSITLHSETSQKTLIFIIAAVRPEILKYILMFRFVGLLHWQDLCSSCYSEPSEHITLETTLFFIFSNFLLNQIDYFFFRAENFHPASQHTPPSPRKKTTSLRTDMNISFALSKFYHKLTQNIC